MDSYELAGMLFGTSRSEGAESTPDNRDMTVYGVAKQSEDGSVLVHFTDDVTLPEDDGLEHDSYIELPSEVYVEDGDEVAITMSGGVMSAPRVSGVIGGGDRMNVRIAEIEADYVKASRLEADVADIGFLKADSAVITNLQADTAKVHNLTAAQLSAATAYIASLNAGNVTAESLIADVGKVHTLTAAELSAAAAYIAALDASSVTAQRIAAISGSFDTVQANAAKVANLTAQELEADHATIGSLDANYAQVNLANVSNAWIASGVIRDAAISDGMINSVSANKLTAGTIDASNITVTNLNADNITTGTINGQRIGAGSLSLDKLSEDVYTEAEVDDIVDGLNDRIDGAIQTYTGTAVPTLNNSPADEWNTVALKDEHVGDVYYVVNSQSQQSGYCYRFTKSGSTYSWQLIKDSDVTAALSRLQTAEGKIGDIEQFDVTVGSFMTDTDDELSSLKTRATTLETSMGDKVDTSTFNTVSQKVDANEANITSMSTVLTNNGLTSSTNITNTVNSVKQTADTNTSNISSLQTTVSGHTTTISQHTTAIQQNTNDISLRATKTEVQQARPAYASSSTAAGTAAKVATIDPAVTGYALYKGASVAVTFSTANTAATPTLNLNSTGAKQIRSYTGATLSEAEYKWAAGATIDLVYDGTYWRMQDGGSVKRVTAAEASISVNAENIESKVSKDGVISSINQSAETVKIQASKVEIDGTAIFTAISSDVDDAITDKGYQTSSQVESAITSKGYATTTQAQGYATTAENSAKAYTDALEIGGRNLLQRTTKTFPKNGTLNTYFAEYTVSNNSLPVAYTLEEGVTYTFSADVESSVEPFQVSIGAGTGGYSRDVIQKSGLSNGSVSVTFTPTATQLSSGTTFAFRAPRYATATNFTYSVDHPKLERGNKATDWTPAPEDIEANAVKRTQRIWYRKSASGAPSTPSTSSSSWVTKDDDGNDAWTKMHIAISSTHKYIYTCEQYEMANGTVGYTSVLLDNTITVIDGGNIITHTVTAEQLNATSINAANSLTIGAMTTATQDAISNDKMEIGGRNLLLGTSNAKAVRASNTDDVPLSAWAKANVSATDNLVVSFDAVAEAACYMDCYWRSSDTSYNSTANFYPSFQLTTSVQHFEATGVSGQDLDNMVSLRFRTNASEHASATGGSAATITNLKLEKGNKATDWTPAPEDQTAYVDSISYQSAQPNLSPFFSMDKDDVYDASTNPTGYWKRIATHAQFTTYEMQVEHNGSEGWAHFAGNVTSGNPFVRFEPVYKDIKPSTTYTFLAEVEGTFNNSSNVNLAFYSGTSQSDAIDPFSTNLTINVKGGGTFYRTGITRADVSTSTVLSRGYLQIYGTGTFDCYIRLSLYEGEYTGPYKPYSGDQLYATNTALAGTNESLEGAIEDIGELSDQLVGTVTEQNRTITDIQTYLNSLRQDLDAEIQSRQQWLNFNSAEGLVIGAAGSTFKTVTTNTSQQFRSGGTVLAETSGTEFVAPVMRSDQLLIGNWMWTRRDNGNLSLKWIG